MDDCGPDWWQYQQLLEEQQQLRYECPYCGKTYDNPQQMCCGECHLKEVNHDSEKDRA